MYLLCHQHKILLGQHLAYCAFQSLVSCTEIDWLFALFEAKLEPHGPFLDLTSVLEIKKSWKGEQIQIKSIKL